MSLNNLFWWAPCWMDTQVGGAMLQVVAAGLVAWAVADKAERDRRSAQTLEFDREWNSLEMIHGRTVIDRRIKAGRKSPLQDDEDFEPAWQVIMYFKRAAALYRSKHFDKALFRDLVQADAGKFSMRINKHWNGWGAGPDVYAVLAVPGAVTEPSNEFIFMP